MKAESILRFEKNSISIWEPANNREFLISLIKNIIYNEGEKTLKTHLRERLVHSVKIKYLELFQIKLLVTSDPLAASPA